MSVNWMLIRGASANPSSLKYAALMNKQSIAENEVFKPDTSQPSIISTHTEDTVLLQDPFFFRKLQFKNQKFYAPWEPDGVLRRHVRRDRSYQREPARSKRVRVCDEDRGRRNGAARDGMRVNPRARYIDADDGNHSAGRGARPPAIDLPRRPPGFRSSRFGGGLHDFSVLGARSRDRFVRAVPARTRRDESP